MLSKDNCTLSKDSFNASHPLTKAACAAAKDWDVATKLRISAIMVRKSRVVM